MVPKDGINSPFTRPLNDLICPGPRRTPNAVRSRKKLKGRNMFGANDREVAPIQCRDSTHTKSLGECHYRCINGPQWKVVISADELCDAYPIACENRLGEQVSGGQITKESHLGRPAQTRFDEIRDFGDDELWHQQRTRVGFQKPQARLMVAVVLVDVGV